MINIHYEDEHCIIVEKPAHLLTHPYKKETNEKANLLFNVRDQINTYLYPIHRLDRQTSGIIIFGKKKEFVRDLQLIWHTEKVQKYYITLVHEKNLNQGIYNFPLKADSGTFKEAITHFSPLAHFEQETLLQVKIETGRRHQIRRHFSRRMQHIAGDRKYGKKRINDRYLHEYGLNRLFLHATNFKFIHPITKKDIEINSKLPSELDKVLDNIKKRQYKNL